MEKEISHRATALRCPETIITRGLRYECGFVSATYGRGTRATTLRTLRAGQEGGGSNNSPSVPPRRINCTKLWRDVTSRKWPDRKISLSLFPFPLPLLARYAEGFIGRPNVEAALTKIEHRPVCVREFLRAEGVLVKLLANKHKRPALPTISEDCFTWTG